MISFGISVCKCSYAVRSHNYEKVVSLCLSSSSQNLLSAQRNSPDALARTLSSGYSGIQLRLLHLLEADKKMRR